MLCTILSSFLLSFGSVSLQTMNYKILSMSEPIDPNHFSALLRIRKDYIEIIQFTRVDNYISSVEKIRSKNIVNGWYKFKKDSLKTGRREKTKKKKHLCGAVSLVSFEFNGNEQNWNQFRKRECTNSLVIWSNLMLISSFNCLHMHKNKTILIKLQLRTIIHSFHSIHAHFLYLSFAVATYFRRNLFGVLFCCVLFNWSIVVKI